MWNGVHYHNRVTSQFTMPSFDCVYGIQQWHIHGISSSSQKYNAIGLHNRWNYSINLIVATIYDAMTFIWKIELNRTCRKRNAEHIVTLRMLSAIICAQTIYKNTMADNLLHKRILSRPHSCLWTGRDFGPTLVLVCCETPNRKWSYPSSVDKKPRNKNNDYFSVHSAQTSRDVTCVWKNAYLSP